MIKYFTSLFALVFSFVSASAQTSQNCPTPEALKDGWTIGSPAAVDMDPEALCSLDAFIRHLPQPNIHAVVVARHGKLVAERYYSGMDQRGLQPAGMVRFSPEAKHDLRAMTEGVVSLLVGIALDEGKFPPLDTPVMDLFPQYAALRTPAKAAITWRQVLTMSSGLGWNEQIAYENPTNSANLLNASADPTRFILEQPMWGPAGAYFLYSSGSTTLLMAALTKATGRALDDYAREKLFAPLEIRDFDWLKMQGSGQFSAWGLRLAARDTAKLGQLLLSDGTWNGKQVLPKKWAAESIKPRINAKNLYYYGYHWWLGRSFLRGRDLAWAGAIGYGGQRMWIVPGLDLVVVVNAGHYGEYQQFVIPEAIFSSLVLPATRD
ncbi:MAG: serine hydrolase [Proteobacteria bacterium]|nr:serine hydrolase [Pseudomonadota bacterium]